ncbi:AI-2E family transporter [Candidatus Woesearchaeota archaeon]|nr:AI-2E family transporter [Candidatus Woesearchaeota archaeon]MBW3021714.1 AI-2E family transporter [Candidatus Woesearchaeota archaeon]
MAKIDFKDYKTYFIIALFIIIAYFSYLLIKPFLTPIILSMVIAYIFYPVYKHLLKVVKSKNVASLLMAIAIILLISFPVYYVAKTTTNEVLVTYLLTKQKLSAGFGDSKCDDTSNMFCNLANFANDAYANPKNKYYVQTGLEKLRTYTVDLTTKLIVGIPKLALNIFLTFFILFFLFRDGKDLMARFKNVLPLKRKHKKRIFIKLNETLYATIFGTLITALIQGAVAGVGYYMFGVTSPVLWGLLTAFFALIPILGTSIVWVPMGLYFLVSGYIDGNGSVIGKGVGILVYGALVISLIDNFVRPKLIGDRAKVHPVLVLLGVLGGIAVMGITGIVIGPIVLALFVTFIKMYEGKE